MSLQEVLSQPLALHQPSISDLLHRMVQQQAQPANAAAPVYNDSPIEDFIVRSGVAVLPVHGLITKRGYWWSSRLSTDRLCEVIDGLIARGDITHLVVDADSGGGQVSGTPRLAETLYRARSTMRTICVVNEFAASAMLWIAAGCERIVIPPTGQMGSLGVYMIHTDWSKYLDELGIKDTVIHAGKYKAIHERTLTPELKAHEQRVIDGIYSEFVDDVARLRGVTSEHVLENWADARVFLGREAVSIGLADEVGTLSDVLDEIATGRSGQILVPTTVENEEPDEMSKATVTSAGAIQVDSKQICSVADLNLTAEQLQAFCGAAVAVLIKAEGERLQAEHKTALEAAVTAAVEKAGADSIVVIEALSTQFPEASLASLMPVIKGEKEPTVFRAEAAEARAKALEESLKAAEKQKAEGGQAPGFAAAGGSPATGQGQAGGGAGTTDVYAQAWNANVDNCQKEFAGVEDYTAYCKAKAAGMLR